MGFLKNILGKKEKPIVSYTDFWNWFQKNEKKFFDVVKQKGDVEKVFLNPLSEELGKIRPGYFFLTGMANDNEAELVFTADGNIKNMVNIEELVDAAPKINGWLFTKHKQAGNFDVQMGGYKFNTKNMHFFATDNPEFPDEINITIVHDEFNEADKAAITNGVYIFLDNYLGELIFASTIDKLSIAGKNDIQAELIPLDKLRDYLNWREKEFIEKYEGTRHNTEDDGYSALEGTLQNGMPLIAVVNADLLQWDAKPSHPWFLTISIKYPSANNSGMPDEHSYKLMDQVEEVLSEQLKDADGYLNVGRETANGLREVYIACKDFRKPSSVMQSIEKEYGPQIDISFDIYKDKYWQTVARFVQQ